MATSRCMMFMALLLAARKGRYLSDLMGGVAANTSGAVYVLTSFAAKRDRCMSSVLSKSAHRAPSMWLPVLLASLPGTLLETPIYRKYSISRRSLDLQHVARAEQLAGQVAPIQGASRPPCSLSRTSIASSLLPRLAPED